ncbi:MAG TPA: tyrosine-type recombinase/integrase [Gaiellaceae bacterium]|nr:tyrosine-type recombinase/integrase [Gaiellaceae bacterium]
MTPRKASLRVAHARSCPNASKTALASAGRGSGCTCQPSYYVATRDRDGRTVKSARVRDRRTAERLLERAQREIDEGRVGIAKPKEITFGAWADEFERILDQRIQAGELHPRTKGSYASTLRRGREAFGSLYLREIGNPELRLFLEPFAHLRPASRLRYLRELSAVLTTAIGDGYLETNPVPRFTKAAKLRAPKRGKAPFEDDELERLWAELGRLEAKVYLYACRFAVETGVRLGELIALEWENVDLLRGRVRVEAQWDDRVGLLEPKDREPRVIYLTPPARQVLAEWVGVVGARAAGPVFPGPNGGRLGRRDLQRRFEAAREAARIPKLHPELRLPRTLHSLRYTTSVLLQRRGYHPRLIEATLGHSSLELTYGVYGGWTPEMLAAEAARDLQA